MEDFIGLISGKLYVSFPDKDKVIYYIPVPGITKEDLSISITQSFLNVICKKDSIFTSASSRKISLPSGVDINNIKVSLELGILCVEVYFEKEKVIEIE